jgi:hypothetical protein
MRSIPGIGMEMSIAHLSIWVFKVLALLCLIAIAAVVTIGLKAGGIEHAPIAILLGAVAAALTLTFAFGGIFMLATMMKLLERIDARLANMHAIGPIARAEPKL